MHKTLIQLTLLLLTGSLLSAQETPLWLRNNAISPDGSTVVFGYKGDLYTVDRQGGRAWQITSNEAYDTDPMWTTDGKYIVFSSYREGSKDIFMTSAQGGTPKRLTDHPGRETPLCVLDGYKVLFSANIQQDVRFGGFPGTPQLFLVDSAARRPEFVTSLPVMAASVNAEGAILYEDYKGYEDALRKHHTSSVTRDIWLCKPAAADGKLRIDGNATFTKLSTFQGEDRNPVFAADGKTYYFLSEQDGTLNVYKGSLGQTGNFTRLTHFKGNPVRFLSVSRNGILCFSWNGELYTLQEGGEPVKLKIQVVRDETDRASYDLNLAGGASSMAVSPNGKEIAVVMRGDVFVTSVEYKTTKRITNTAEQERDVSFGKDGRTLYYSAERDGHWGIYRASLENKDDKYFTYARDIREELFTDKGQTCFQPDVSPDGEWVAFLRDRTELVVKSTKNGKEKSLLKGVNYSYKDGDLDFQWSPDSRFLMSTYQADGGWNNTDVALIEVETGEITNLTRSGYSDHNFKWSLKGKAMTWSSDKDGYRSHGSWGTEGDVYIMFFDGKAMTKFARDKEDEDIVKILSGDSEKKIEKQEKKDSIKQEKKPEKLKLELEDRDTRIRRLTRFSGMLGDFYLTQDGTRLYYVERLEKSSDLCVMDIKKGDIRVLRKGVSGTLVPSPDDKYLYVFSGGSIQKLTMATGATERIEMSGNFEFKPRAERSYMFEHIWKQVKEKFYDPAMHGIDWEACGANYRRFLPYISDNNDFQDLLSEMLGELNGSHTGARYRGNPSMSSGRLGVLFDYDYAGDGLRIAEVLPGGVLNLADSEIKAGDIIETIDGKAIKAGESWYRLLANKAGSKIAIGIKKDGKGKTKELFVQPSSSDGNLLYRRWVRQRQDMVQKLSGGKVGYTHIQDMDSPSFREAYSTLLGKYRSAEAAVVDTRHNGGGWLHDDLATFLSGKPYIRFAPRNQYIGTEPYNKWTKPSCVLVCEDNYSDASGFPYTYRTLGIGKLIGAPVPGTMTAVWWENQINPAIVFGIPQVGSWAIKEGRYLENLQLEPDILIYNDPASLLRGEDRQLEAAVAEMMKSLTR